MKFKYIGEKIFSEEGKEIPANSYGGELVYFGDIVELNDFFSEKANINPNYEKITRGPKKKSLLVKDASDEID